jgi:ketosteroid isomerase-like protein
MSQENVELHYGFFDAFNQRDLDAVLALLDDDVDAASRVASLEGGFRGHDGFRRLWESVLDVMPDSTIEVVEAHDLGNVTIAALHQRGRGAGSGIPYDETVWQAARWQRGKCVWFRTCDTQAEALEAAGLKE